MQQLVRVSRAPMPTTSECHSGVQAKGYLPHLLVNTAHTAFFTDVATAQSHTAACPRLANARDPGSLGASWQGTRQLLRKPTTTLVPVLRKVLPKRHSEEGDESHLVVALVLLLLLLPLTTPEAVGSGRGACQWRHSGP